MCQRCLHHRGRWSHEIKTNMPSGALRQKNESMSLSKNSLRGHVGCCPPFTVLLKTTKEQGYDVHAKCKHMHGAYTRSVQQVSCKIKSIMNGGGEEEFNNMFAVIRWLEIFNAQYQQGNSLHFHLLSTTVIFFFWLCSLWAKQCLLIICLTRYMWSQIVLSAEFLES